MKLPKDKGFGTEFSSVDQMKGWCVMGLKIGRVSIGAVHVFDAEGAYNFREFFHGLMQKTQRNRKNTTNAPFSEPESRPIAKLVSAEVADYLRELKRRRKSSSTVENTERYLRFLKVATGEIPVSMINDTHINEFLEVVRWFPERAGSFKKYRGLTDRELYQIGRESNRAPPAGSSLDLAQSLVSSFFNWLIQKKKISSSPMDGFGKIKGDMCE